MRDSTPRSHSMRPEVRTMCRRKSANRRDLEAVRRTPGSLAFSSAGDALDPVGNASAQEGAREQTCPLVARKREPSEARPKTLERRWESVQPCRPSASEEWPSSRVRERLRKLERNVRVGLVQEAPRCRLASQRAPVPAAHSKDADERPVIETPHFSLPAPRTRAATSYSEVVSSPSLINAASKGNP